MIIKKSGKTIFGAELNNSERKALEIEIKKEIAAWDRDNAKELSAIVLYILHTQYGFGMKRLKQFYELFGQSVKELANRYEMDNSESLWLCTQKMRDYGVDLEAWEKEFG